LYLASDKLTEVALDGPQSESGQPSSETRSDLGRVCSVARLTVECMSGLGHDTHDDGECEAHSQHHPKLAIGEQADEHNEDRGLGSLHDCASLRLEQRMTRAGTVRARSRPAQRHGRIS